MKKTKAPARRLLLRISRFIYHMIAISLLGKLFTSYAACDDAVTGRRRGNKKKSDRARVPHRYTVRRALACAMEQNLLSRAIRRVLLALAGCSLRTFGLTFTVLGVSFVALYGVSLFISLGNVVTWMHLVSGITALTVGVFLLFSERSLGAALRCSLVGLFFFRVLGVSDEPVREVGERGAQHYFIGTVLALLFAAIGLLIEPISILLILACTIIALTVLTVPEAGLLLALFFLPFSKLLVGSDLLYLSFLALMLLGYLGKLLRGNRVFRLELQDLPVLFFILLFFLSGYSVSGKGVWGDVLFKILLGLVYLIAVNVLSTPRWLGLTHTVFVVSAVGAALVGLAQLLLAFLAAGDVGFFDLPLLSSALRAGFADKTAFGYYLLVALAFTLPLIPLTKKRYRALPLMAAAILALTAALTCSSVVWLTMLLILVVFLLVFESRSFLYIFFGSGAVTGALLLLPQRISRYFFNAFSDITAPTYRAVREASGQVVSRVFFCNGEGFFSRANGLLRFFFGAGQGGLVSLSPYFADLGVPLGYEAYNHWQILLVDYGIGGVIVFVFFLLILLQNCFSVLAISQEQDRPALSFVGILFVAVLIFISFFCYVWYDIATLATFFAAAALVSAAMRYHRHQREKVSEGESHGSARAEIDYRSHAAAKKQ